MLLIWVGKGYHVQKYSSQKKTSADQFLSLMDIYFTKNYLSSPMASQKKIDFLTSVFELKECYGICIIHHCSFYIFSQIWRIWRIYRIFISVNLDKEKLISERFCLFFLLLPALCFLCCVGHQQYNSNGL